MIRPLAGVMPQLVCTDGRAMVRLAHVHGDVGLSEQLAAVLRARPVERAPGTHRDLYDPVLERVWRIQLPANLVDYGIDTLRAIDFGQHHDKLIATVAAGRVATADASRKPRRHLLQELVPGSMAKPVVDALELIEVKQHDAHLFVQPHGLSHRLSEPVEQQAAVWESCQRVVISEMARLYDLLPQTNHCASQARIALREHPDTPRRG